MKYVIEEHTEDYRGDHEADVVIAWPPIDNETVIDLILRCLKRDRPQDYLVLRRVREETTDEK